MNLFENLVQRAERDRQTLCPAYVHEAVRTFEESEEVSCLRRAAKAFVKASHVSAPDCFRREIDQKLEGQRLLIIKLVHVGRWHFVRRAPSDVLAYAAAQLSRTLIK